MLFLHIFVQGNCWAFKPVNGTRKNIQHKGGQFDKMFEAHTTLGFHHADSLEQGEIIKDLIHGDLHSMDLFRPFGGRERAHSH